jgi:hypothetical protein
MLIIGLPLLLKMQKVRISVMQSAFTYPNWEIVDRLGRVCRIGGFPDIIALEHSLSL